MVARGPKTFGPKNRGLRMGILIPIRGGGIFSLRNSKNSEIQSLTHECAQERACTCRRIIHMGMRASCAGTLLRGWAPTSRHRCASHLRGREAEDRRRPLPEGSALVRMAPKNRVWVDAFTFQVSADHSNKIALRRALFWGSSHSSHIQLARPVDDRPCSQGRVAHVVRKHLDLVS